MRVYVLHDLAELHLDPAAENLKAVIAGHSHRPMVEERAGVVYINPGSAGPRRFKLPVAVARLRIAAGEIEARVVELAGLLGLGRRDQRFAHSESGASAAPSSSPALVVGA